MILSVLRAEGVVLEELELRDEHVVLEVGSLRAGDGGLPLEEVVLRDGPGVDAVRRVLSHQPSGQEDLSEKYV